MNKYNTNWESLDSYTCRLKVFGGWIVKVLEDVVHDTTNQGLVDGWDFRVSTCYVPDAKHEWKIEEECDERD